MAGSILRLFSKLDISPVLYFGLMSFYTQIFLQKFNGYHFKKFLQSCLGKLETWIVNKQKAKKGEAVQNERFAKNNDSTKVFFFLGDFH